MSEPIALAGRPLADVLDAVAAVTPAPGGGSCAALACGLAAGLAEMSARFALRRDADHERARAIAQRAQSARAQALELAQRELTAFAPVLEAMRAPEQPGRDQRLAAALSDAAESPLAIAALAAELAELAAEIAATGSAHLAGDATAGALLAEAACQAAVRLVALNLAGVADDPRCAQAGALAGRAGAARERALAAAQLRPS